MKGILKFVGAQYWPWPQDHITETRNRGPSIRVAPDFIPDLEVPYPIIFVHPRGTFSVTAEDVDIHDLLTEMGLEYHIPIDAVESAYIVDGLPTLAFIAAFKFLDEHVPEEYERIVEKYGIEFSYAATHYSYITGVQVVVGEDGKGLELADLLESRGVEVEPVKVNRVKEENDVGTN